MPPQIAGEGAVEQAAEVAAVHQDLAGAFVARSQVAQREIELGLAMARTYRVDVPIEEVEQVDRQPLVRLKAVHQHIAPDRSGLGRENIGGT